MVGGEKETEKMLHLFALPDIAFGDGGRRWNGSPPDIFHGFNELRLLLLFYSLLTGRDRPGMNAVFCCEFFFLLGHTTALGGCAQCNNTSARYKVTAVKCRGWRRIAIKVTSTPLSLLDMLLLEVTLYRSSIAVAGEVEERVLCYK